MRLNADIALSLLSQTLYVYDLQLFVVPRGSVSKMTWPTADSDPLNGTTFGKPLGHHRGWRTGVVIQRSKSGDVPGMM